MEAKRVRAWEDLKHLCWLGRWWGCTQDWKRLASGSWKQPWAKSQQGNRVFSPMTTRNWILPMTWMTLEADSSPDKTPARQNFHFHFDPMQRTHASPSRSDLQKYELINGCCFKLLKPWFVTQLRKPTHCLTLWAYTVIGKKRKERSPTGSPSKAEEQRRPFPAGVHPFPSQVGKLGRKATLFFYCKHMLYDNVFFCPLLFFFYVSCFKLSR